MVRSDQTVRVVTSRCTEGNLGEATLTRINVCALSDPKPGRLWVIHQFGRRYRTGKVEAMKLNGRSTHVKSNIINYQYPKSFK